ncbi:MAG: hypothetical protein DME21_00810 [Verrucomicrobia bacterium]|nr:MAG: hypothetical protein DME21_00810 [Verrucomicrobiota bacterium]
MGAQLAQMSQARRQLWPLVGDQCRQKAAAACGAQRPRRRQKLIDSQIIPLKINACKPIHLQVHQRRRDPSPALDRPGCGAQMGDDAVAPFERNRFAGRVMMRADFALLHGLISVCSTRVGKQNILVIPQPRRHFHSQKLFV